MNILFQLLLLGLVSLSCCALIKNKIAAIATSIVLGVFLTLQLVSVQLGGSVIDYKFYEHLNIAEAWSLRGFYAKEYIVFTLVLVVLVALLYYGSRFLRRKAVSWKILAIAVIVGVVGMSFPNGIVHNIYSIANIKFTQSKSFETALEDLGIDPENYIEPDDLTATAGKNIIVLSLESLERGFLEAPLEALTPTLGELRDTYTYFPMEQNEGSKWTSGSVYTTMTGFPAYFKASNNDIFQNTTSSRITSIGDVLQAAEYDLTYLMGNKEFSGLNDMLSLFGFRVKSEQELGVPKIKSLWGLHDKELFEAAKKEITTKSKKEKPFALFLSNISGHFPDGVYDERMREVIPDQESKLEFMTMAVDYLIADLFAYLEENNLMDNTAVYIFPDHEFMGKHPVLQKFSAKRGLYLITTADKESVSYKRLDTLSQIDLPRIILNGAGIESNAKFLTDYISEENENAFLDKNIKNILALNEASLETVNYHKGIRLSLTEENNIAVIAEGTKHLQLIPKIKEDEFYRLAFDDEMHYTGYKTIALNSAFHRNEYLRLIFSVSEGNIFAHLQQGKHIGVAKMGEGEVFFDPDDISIFKDWAAIVPEKEIDHTKIYLKSTGFEALKTRGKSKLYTGLEPHKVSRGLNVLYLENDQYRVRNFDTFATREAASNFIIFAEELLKEDRFVAMLIHDSGTRMLKKHKKMLEYLGFSVLNTVASKQPYIAYFENSVLIEKTGDKSVEIEIPYYIKNSEERREFNNDRSRFIAHAGGMIDGNKSTNSLEALNQSYTNGFRYFELDILKTSDNRFVAAHDWESWATKTGYQGSLPPTEQVFMQQSILNQYTPMNMTDINRWFSKHPDAILVTDKINEPKAIKNAFIDPSRLMMEVFSIEAFNEANALGLKGVILSHNVYKGIKGNKFDGVMDLNVKHLAISRRAISNNIEVLLKLKAAGVRTYVYNINFDKGKDENYVATYEMPFIYGMYADKWNFPDGVENNTNSN